MTDSSNFGAKNFFFSRTNSLDRKNVKTIYQVRRPIPHLFCANNHNDILYWKPLKQKPEQIYICSDNMALIKGYTAFLNYGPLRLKMIMKEIFLKVSGRFIFN